MRKKFAEIYGVNLSDFKMKFDGSIVKDSETPEDLDMTDEDMIDVEVGRRFRCCKLLIMSSDGQDHGCGGGSQCEQVKVVDVFQFCTHCESTKPSCSCPCACPVQRDGLRLPP